MPYQGRQPGVGVRNRFIYTATGGQTLFSGADSNGRTLAYQDGAYVDVYLNGVMLVPTTDFTATTKTSVSLTSGAAASDVVEIVCYDIASMADTVSKSQGGTFDNDIAINGDLTVDTNTLFVDAANNQVGIGVTDMSVSGANAKLAVAGGVLNLDDTQAIAWGGGTGRPSINGVKSTGFLNLLSPSNTVFSVNNTERMRIDSSGNVGVGTSSPGQKFGVNGNAIILAGNELKFAGPANTNVSGIKSPTDDGSLAFITNNTSERMRITSGGAVLAATTGAVSGNSHTFQSLSTSNADFGLAAVHTASNGDVRGILSKCPNFNGDDGYFFIGNRSGGDRIYIRTSGNLENSNNSYGALSDIKLKENIVDATPKLEKLNQVRIVNFNLIGDDRKQIGVIAQELEQIFPGMVEESSDRDAEGNDLGTTTKSVKYSVFVPMLIKAMQEQQAIIEALEARVAALEA